MGQLIVNNLVDRLIEALVRRAARNARYVEVEHRAIFEQALDPRSETFAEAAARLRARMPAQTTNSADLVRQDRDRDQAGGNN
jgi:antitoxin FitA